MGKLIIIFFKSSLQFFTDNFYNTFNKFPKHLGNLGNLETLRKHLVGPKTHQHTYNTQLAKQLTKVNFNTNFQNTIIHYSSNTLCLPKHCKHVSKSNNFSKQ